MGVGDSESGAAGVTYTISDAARAAGVHPHTIRKRIKAGKLQATKVEGPNGPEYRIPIDAVHQLAAEVVEAKVAGAHPQHAGSAAPSAARTAAWPAGSAPTVNDFESAPPSAAAGPRAGAAAPSIDSGTVALAVARAQEMAAYTQRLLEPLQGHLREQAEEIGRLKAELEHAREAIAERGALPAATAAAAPARPRPWWRFW